MPPIGPSYESRDAGGGSRQPAALTRKHQPGSPRPLAALATPKGKRITAETHPPAKIALPLVPICIYSPESKHSHLTYALLDNGSNLTWCHERLLRILGLQGWAETMSLTTLDKEHSRTPTKVISLEVTDPDGEGRLLLGQVYTRDSLPIDPRNMVTTDETAKWSHLKGLPLHHAPADEVILLIGQDYLDALVPLATVPREKGEPYAVKTRLGWTVNRPVANSKMQVEQQAFFTQGECFEQLNQKLERFWKLESSGLYEDDRAMSVQDKLVTARWEDAAIYDDGHFTPPDSLSTRGAMATR